MKRGSGILLHISSLPSDYGIGDLGPGAYQFADYLAEAGQRYWQVLPLNPTADISGNSPYSSYSAFAGNGLLISPEELHSMGLLEQSDLKSHPDFLMDKVNFPAVIEYKEKLLQKSYDRFKENRDEYVEEYESFVETHDYWLEEFATFVAFKEHFDQKGWMDWPEEYRDRDPDALLELKQTLADRIQYRKFIQFVFFRQWYYLKKYCNDKDIQIIGDIPYYVTLDSADVWTHPQRFKLTEEKQPEAVAGVPPDYFSETGQLWGNPVYRWDVMQELDYDWWIQRLAHNFLLFDWARIDHFRGFEAYWEVPADEKTAVNGEWVDVPSYDFFNTVLTKFDALPIIAEDLGMITDEVRELIAHFNFPGMKVLQFAFDDHLPENPYAPHNHVQNCALYTGTHDNNTSRGWFNREADTNTKGRLSHYLGKDLTQETIHEDFMRMALSSVADLAVLPMQDVLGLGADCRMNKPGVGKKNWEWRLEPSQLNDKSKELLASLTHMYGRLL